jgi:hypothetical protein
MFLGTSAPAEIAGSTGRVGNVIQSPHLPTGKPNAVAEAELRDNWKAELAAQEPALRGPIAPGQTGLQLANSAPASFPPDSPAAWPDRLTGEIQSGSSSVQIKSEAEDESFGENLSDVRTNVAKSSRVPNVFVSSALVSEKISGRVTSRDFARLPEPRAGVTSKHDASTSLESSQTGSVKHSRHASPTGRDWRAGNSQKFQVSPASSLQVNPAVAVVEAVTAQAGESGAFGGDRLVQIDEGSSSGLHPAAPTDQAAENNVSTRDGSPFITSNSSWHEGSGRETTLSTGLHGLTGIPASHATDETSHGISGAVASASLHSEVEDVRNAQVLADDEINETAASTAIRGNGLMRGGLDDPSLLSATSFSRVGLPEASSPEFPEMIQSAMIRSSTEAASLSVNPTGTKMVPATPEMSFSGQLRSSPAARFGKERADMKTDYRTSMVVDPSDLPSVSSHVGGTAGLAHAGVLASAQVTPAGASLAPEIFSSGEQTRTGANRELGRDPFPALDSFGATDATDATSRLHGSQINSQSVAGRSLSLGEHDGVRALEVGYQDPVLGYVELRAHTEGAGIHASLTAQSADSGAALEAHLSSLANWMNERRTPVESLTVSSALQGHAGQSGHSRSDAQADSRDGGGRDQHPSSIWGAGDASPSTMRSVPGLVTDSGSTRTSGLVASLTERSQSELELSGSNISVVA